ncbi:MAG: hypothetical protein ACI86M_000338 [Saprospiraceae bacterium]|jgi:hypothetical protein
MVNSNKYLDLTKQWVERLVIGLNLCPFAKHSFNNGLIHYELSESDDFRPMMEELVILIEKLNATEQEEISNALMIYSSDVSFEFLLDLEYSFLGVLEEAGLDTKYQTVAFHPQFRYEGEEINSHGNFTNRSPYPMIHILRAEEVSNAIATTLNVELIPENNAAKLDRLALKRISEVFEEGFEDRVAKALK